MRRRRQSFSMLEREASSEAEESKGSSTNWGANTKPATKSDDTSDTNLQYIISDDGKDAKFISGVNKGKWISELVKTLEGRDYMGSIWKYGKRDLQKVMRGHFSD